MKKLALALVCLVGVAFFASCNKTVENPEPTISIYEEEGFVKDGDVVDLNTEIQFGFVMASNAETEKELKSLTVKIGEAQETIDLTGLTEYTYKDAITFTLEARDIVAEGVIEATVIDEDGETATATITLSLNEAAQPLEVSPLRWYRLGSGNNVIEEGLEEFGLYWEKNIKDTHAQIKPLEGVTLYKFDSEKWDATTTDVEKAALFSDGAISILVYNNVSTTVGGTYDDVLGTKMADGTMHLIHITKCEIGEFQTQGYPITITGEAK